MALIDMERALLSVCFAARPDPAQLALLGDESGVLLYRGLVRDRLAREIRNALPRSCALLGQPGFEREFVRYLEDDPPRTRFFREIPLSFVRSGLCRWQSDPDLPPACVDTFRYEAALWEVSDLDESATPAAGEFAFDRAVLLSPALRLLQLRYGVHLPSGPDGQPVAGDHYLCVHRARGQAKARTWTLTKTTYVLLQRLQAEDATVAQIVQRMAAASGGRIDAKYLDALCETLCQFIELGIVLGSR